jgi:mannose-6-phosphate isomerase class I
MQLDCTAQNYAWGIKGKASMVAKFKAVSSATSTIQEDQCYAELW